MIRSHIRHDLTYYVVNLRSHLILMQCHWKDASEVYDTLNQNHINKLWGSDEILVKAKGVGTISKHIHTLAKCAHIHTFLENLNQRLRWAVTLASVIDCPPRFVCLWVPVGIPMESRESMRTVPRKTIRQVAAISPGTQTCMSPLVSAATADTQQQKQTRLEASLSKRVSAH